MNARTRTNTATTLLAAAALGLTVTALSPSQSAARGASADGRGLYAAKCASCHSADGSGNTPAGKKMGAPDLRSAKVQGLSDGQLFSAITNGKGKMPGYGKSLGDAERQQLVAHIRTLGR
jgi:mono/diheme cytochrome c family protein